MKSKLSITRLILIIPVLAALLAVSFLPVQAAVIDDDGIIEANQVIDDDLLISSASISMDGTINGNLLAAGRNVVINGKVNGDVLVIANNLIISDTAEIDGNIFGGAGIITVNGKVNGSIFGGSRELYLKDGASLSRNIYYGGYQLSTTAETDVKRDIFAATYQSILNGSVERNVNISSAAVEINGKIGKDVNLQVGSPDQSEAVSVKPYLSEDTPKPLQPGLKISKDAVIGGKLTYTSSSDQSAQFIATPQGGVVYQTPVPSETEKPAQTTAPVQPATPEWVGSLANITFDIIRNFFTLLVLGALALWLIPDIFKKTSEFAQNKPGQSTGLGFLVILAGYFAAFLTVIVLILVAIVLSLITLGGLSATIFGVGFSGLSFIMAVFTLLITYGSKLVVAYLIGGLIIKKLAPQASRPEIWGLVIGILLYALFQAIPFFGFLINLLITCVGVGAIWLYFTSRKSQHSVIENAPVI
ncbi:MAG: polymer-forming cytoskeletal protein [Anaerolineae bacterium]|nr:polymer-forming cytoskeletal protein [Anaerolineae bacterium]